MIKKIINIGFIFSIFYLMLSCQSQKIVLTGNLPKEDNLPKLFRENIMKHKVYLNEHPDSTLIKFIKVPEESVYHVFENDKEYSSIDNVKFWVIFNYKTGIKELIERITNTKEIGLMGTYNLVIIGRVENGDMQLETGDVINYDLFRVSGRAS